MNGRLRIRSIPFVFFIAAFFFSPAVRAQGSAEESKGINSGDYNIHQVIEFGYRSSNINGNMNTYNTFENLGSGVRLFDFEVKMHALDHNGLLFDNLTFSNFGYGGDPNNVSRMHVEKNKWYDFRLLFRRDKNFWDYNLFANPLNPAALNPAGSLTTGCFVGPPTAAFPQGAPAFCSNPAVAQNSSLHSLYLTRRMQDYDLTILPTSRIRFRLGYSRNRNQGPGSFTTDGGTISDFQEMYSYTTNAYRAGVDFRILPRTTLSFDEFLSYYKQDNVVIDNPAVNPGNFGFALGTVPGQGTPAGTPVDLGTIWSTQTAAETFPCATPIVAGTTNTANPTCNAYLSYSQVGNPRNFMPTERFRFQSNYFKNFETSGSFGYNTSDNRIPDFLETVNGFTARSAERGSTTGGPANAKRISVNADWTGAYAITEKLRILDFFRYDNWRIPGMWDTAETAVYGTPSPGPGVVGLLLSPGVFNPANCTAALKYNQPTCPQHTTSSAADVTNEIASQFLAQNIKSNTLELKYDFNRRYSARIGYLYTNRKIASESAVFDTGEFYFPGGVAGTAANHFLAARGDCALVGGALPAACTLLTTGAFAGAVVEGSPTNPIPEAGNDTARNITSINEQSLLLGFNARPIDALRINGDFEFGYNDQSFTRIDPRQVQSYKIHAKYKPKAWANLDGAVEIHENRDNVATVDNLEHDRSYSFATILTASPRLSVDFGYNYWDVYTQSIICFAYSQTSANPTPPPATVVASAFPPGVPELPTGPACPITGASSPLGALSTYSSTDHFAHAAMIWKPMKRVTAMLGYGGSFVRGNTIFLNPLTPSGTLDFNYQRPYASIAIDIARGLSYKMSWNYYGFNQAGSTNPFGLAAIQSQDFNGSNATFSFRYSF
ncbi:MAG TPA: hypothetical protein VFF95_12960 [Candidatus Binatus sp.]|nr:hypothetical protein [Candidatus Binatus sp.]